jgi:hypothetical protein
VLWCANARQGKSNRWSFPPAVEKHLCALTEGKRVLQMFGGFATWGTKLDIDVSTRPHVLGDAWLPPFRRDAFDVVILDPPYFPLNQQMKQQLLRAAAYVARERVVWFHTIWIAGDGACAFERGWLVRVGDSCAARVLQVFRSSATDKPKPRPRFTRGPAIKYNRWLAGAQRLPFERISA